MNWRTVTSQIPHGNAGNLHTLRAMSSLAQAGSIDPIVVQAAQDAVRSAPERDPDADFAAILADVRRRMRYTHDPLGAEVVKAPRFVIDRTNASRYPEPMDCDDASTLAGAMLGAIGYPVRFVTVAADKSRPDEWSHVYLTVQHPNGRWVPIDPIVRSFDAGDEVPAHDLTAPRAYHEGVDPMMRGIGCGPRSAETSLSGFGAVATPDGSPLSQWVLDDEGNPLWRKDFRQNQSSTSSPGTGPADVPWYSQLISATGGFFKSESDIAQANAATAIARANAKIARAKSPSGPGIFKNADGSTNMTNVVLAGVGVALAGFLVLKIAGRRGR